LSATEIPKILYSPRKAFKEIAQNPKYLGPLIIIVLLVVANIGFAYALLSKTYIEQPLPNGSNKDEWTENSTLPWAATPNAAITDNYNDSINGTDNSVYGKKSKQFSINDSAQMWMQLTGIGSIDCLGPDGYKNLSLRIKQISPATSPSNATIYMLSATPSDYFYRDLTQYLNPASNIWNNLTVPLGSEGWSSTGTGADWSNITGLKLEFTWLDNSNITVLLDDLFFRGPFKSQLEIYGTSYLLEFPLLAVMQFVITWVFISGLTYIMSKGLKGNLIWKPLLIVVGFILVTMLVQTVVNAVIYSTSPTVRVPLEYFGTEAEQSIASNAIAEQTWLASQILRFLQIAVSIWIIALCSLAVRTLAEFGWAKSILLAAAAYVVTTWLESILLG